MQGAAHAPSHLPLRWALHDVNFALHGVPEPSEMLGVSKPMIEAAAPLALLAATISSAAGLLVCALMQLPSHKRPRSRSSKNDGSAHDLVLRDPWAEACGCGLVE